jgi:Uma2 family endonuclease
MPDAAPKRSVGVAEYLAMERSATEKHVLWDGEVFAMAGGSREHNLLVAAVLRELGVRLRGGPCQPYASDQRIRLPSLSRYVYPDASVTCRPVEIDPADGDTITNPRLVVEVLSDSTEGFDRGEKFVAYRSVPSLVDYLLVSQRAARVEHYSRQADGGWVLRTYGSGSVVPVVSLGIELPVKDIYEGVFPVAADQLA